MIYHDSYQDSTPAIIKTNGATVKLKRIPLSERLIAESWIQENIERNPELLPISDIEPVFSPALSIGREIVTKVGPIDNLFISPNGYLTIVETKLWRNPEARRQVVGQIIDYAKEIANWGFEQLDEAVRSYNENNGKLDTGIIETIKRYKNNDVNEQGIIDVIGRNLRNCRFLLLIVGDGIHESVEDMVNFLQKSPNLQFTLALVELKLYRTEDKSSGDIIVVPQLVTKTKEITRAIVRVEGSDIKSVQVEIPMPEEEENLGTEESFIQKSGYICQELYYELKDLRKLDEFKYSDFTKSGGFAVRYLQPRYNVCVLYPDYLKMWLGPRHSDEVLSSETVESFYSELYKIKAFKNKKDKLNPELAVTEDNWSTEDTEVFVNAVKSLVCSTP